MAHAGLVVVVRASCAGRKTLLLTSQHIKVEGNYFEKLDPGEKSLQPQDMRPGCNK